MNPEIKEKKIFFHVGLGKTGSTWLQDRFFPILKGVYYIYTAKFKSAAEIIRNSSESRILVSREFDQQYETELVKFHSHSPESYIIIFLRRHDSWIASQYRRFVKNGFPGSFTEFIDLKEDKGYWKKKDLEFFYRLPMAELYSGHVPLVIFYEDFRKDSTAVLNRLCDFMGATYNPAELNTDSKHASWEDKQLKFVRKWGKYFYSYKKKPVKNPVLRWMRRILHQGMRYTLLFLGRILPEAWIGKEDLIEKSELEWLAAKGAG